MYGLYGVTALGRTIFKQIYTNRVQRILNLIRTLFNFSMPKKKLCDMSLWVFYFKTHSHRVCV